MLTTLLTSKLAGIIVGWLLSAFQDWLAKKRAETRLQQLGAAEAAAKANQEASNAQNRMADSNAQVRTREDAARRLGEGSA